MALLELKHISKSFGQNQVLRDVNFELRPGKYMHFWERMVRERLTDAEYHRWSF